MSGETHPYRVVIVQEHIPHYRLPFYEKLRALCLEKGVVLEVIYSPQASIAAIPGDLTWARKVKSKKMGGIVIQQLPKFVWNADLVVVAQETKYLMTYFLQAWCHLTGRKIAMWGHGKDFQSDNEDSIRNRIKRWISRRVSWWFAYNDLSAEVVRQLGFSEDRITSVQNSIDIEKITEARNAVSPAQLDRLKRQLGIHSENIAIFTGRFNTVKRTSFLLEAAKLVQNKLHDFHLILIGQGPLQKIVDEAVEMNPWIHSVGVKDDTEKVPYWMLSKLLLMPGAVGLVVLDSFALGVPMVTIDMVRHGPEIAYLKGKPKAVSVLANTPQAYANEVVELLTDERRLGFLREECLKAAKGFSTEKMAENFFVGIQHALHQ